MMLNFLWRVSIYKLSHFLNNYPPQFNGGHFFWGHAVHNLTVFLIMLKFVFFCGGLLFSAGSLYTFYAHGQIEPM